MSAPMKTRRTKQEVRIQIGKNNPRLFLVPKNKTENIVQLLKDFEVIDSELVSWKEPVRDLIEAHSEPGVALRGARVKEGINQSALALKLGIPPSNISEMESGKRPIGKAMAKRLSKALKINYRVFL